MTQAKINLDNAVVDVCRSAQELVDNTDFNYNRGDYSINQGDFKQLMVACDSWKKATQEFLSAASEEPPCRTMKQLADEALGVQDACNLSGVVHSFSKVMTELRQNLSKEGDFGTEKINKHPIAVLFTSKIASLTGYDVSDRHRMPGIITFADAYNWAKEMTR